MSTLPESKEKTHAEPSCPALRIKNVRKLYDDLEVIKNVSLDVAQNEFVSVVGPSGCGKSTLLMMITGLVNRSDGEISIMGEPVTGPRPEIGMVFQQPVSFHGAPYSTTYCFRSMIFTACWREIRRAGNAAACNDEDR